MRPSGEKSARRNVSVSVSGIGQEIVTEPAIGTGRGAATEIVTGIATGVGTETESESVAPEIEPAREIAGTEAAQGIDTVGVEVSGRTAVAVLRM